MDMDKVHVQSQTIKEKSFSEREKAHMKASDIFEQRAIPHFNNLNKSLDVGKSNGYTGFALAKHFKKVVSIDSNPGSLKIGENKALEKNIKNIQFLLMDAHRLKFPDKLFDVVTCRAAIHHFDNPDEVLSEIHRVLKTDGFFVIMDFCFSETTRNLIAPLAMVRENDFKKYYTFHEWCDLIENNGFLIDTIYTYTLPRVVQEWAAAGPEEIQNRIVDAFLGLDEKVHKELRLQKKGNKDIITYRIVEIIARKKG